MAKIFSLNPLYEILIDDKCVLRCDEEFISIELPGSFNWHHHAQNCIECKAFLSSFGKATYKWLLEFCDQHYRLDLVGFGKQTDYYTNLSKFENSKDFWGTKWRFKITEINRASLEALLIIRKEDEQYERCSELKDIIKFLDEIQGN